MAESKSDKPGSIDFGDATQVHGWITQTVQQRVWRPRFFAAIAATLNSTFDRPIDVAEFNSGAGYLAREILGNCRIASYAAIDASAAVHDAAREHLGEAARGVRFMVSNSEPTDWRGELAAVDAVLTMPATEDSVGHDRRVPLLPSFRKILRPEGLLLYCDHYDRGRSDERAPAQRREQLPQMLQMAGFRRVEELLDLGGMVLLRALA